MAVLRCAVFAAILLFAAAGRSAGAVQPLLEYEVKAAFLLNFVRFTEWPSGAYSSPSAPITICIVRPDPFGEMLDAIVQGEVIQGRGVTVRRIGDDERAQGCHVLFLPGGARSVSSLIDHVRNSPTLTVGETDGFLSSGGAIKLFLERDKVRFAMNPEVAERAGVRLSSHLLRLARVVRLKQDRL